MIKPFVRRPVTWMLLVGLLISAFAFTACGGPAATVNVKETKAASGDTYFCDPDHITISKGSTVDFTNQSDENQDFDMGDAKKAGVDFKIGLNQTVSVTFNNAGTFTIISEKAQPSRLQSSSYLVPSCNRKRAGILGMRISVCPIHFCL